MGKLTSYQRRFLSRVHLISFAPWSGTLTAADEKGEPIRIGKPTFEKLEKARLIVRSGSSLVANHYVVSDIGKIAISDPEFDVLIDSKS